MPSLPHIFTRSCCLRPLPLACECRSMIGVCSKGKLIWGFIPSERIVPQMHTNSPVKGRSPNSSSLGCSSDIHDFPSTPIPKSPVCTYMALASRIICVCSSSTLVEDPKSQVHFPWLCLHCLADQHIFVAPALCRWHADVGHWPVSVAKGK